MGKLFLSHLVVVAAAVAIAASWQNLMVLHEIDPGGTVAGVVCWALVAVAVAVGLAASALQEQAVRVHRQAQAAAIQPETLCKLQREQYAGADPSPM